MPDKQAITRLSIIISVISALLIIVHAFYPEWRTDAVTLGLLLVGILPWLHPLVKAIQLPGGWKIELQDFKHQLKEVTKELEEVGLIKSSLPAGTTVTATGTVGKKKKQSRLRALIELRTEIENKLQGISTAFTPYGSEGLEHLTLSELISALSRSGILQFEQSIALNHLVELINRAIHGPELEPAAFEWAMENGPRLLKSFDHL